VIINDLTNDKTSNALSAHPKLERQRS